MDKNILDLLAIKEAQERHQRLAALDLSSMWKELDSSMPEDSEWQHD